MLTTIFIISLTLAFILVLRISFLSYLISKGDRLIIRGSLRLNEWFNHNKEKTFFFFLIHIPNYIEKIFFRLKLRANEKYHDILGSVRGKRELKNGHPSPFMRDLSK